MTHRPNFSDRVKLRHPRFLMFLCLLTVFMALLWPAVGFGRATLIGFDLAAAAFAIALCATVGRAPAELRRTEAFLFNIGILALTVNVVASAT